MYHKRSQGVSIIPTRCLAVHNSSTDIIIIYYKSVDTSSVISKPVCLSVRVLPTRRNQLNNITVSITRSTYQDQEPVDQVTV